MLSELYALRFSSQHKEMHSMSKLVKIVSPVDGSVVAERPFATQAEIDAALAEAGAAEEVAENFAR